MNRRLDVLSETLGALRQAAERLVTRAGEVLPSGD